MKLFFRYLLLIACVMVVGVWISSIWYTVGVVYQGDSALLVHFETGRFGFWHFQGGRLSHQNGLTIESTPIRTSIKDIPSRLGFAFPFYRQYTSPDSGFSEHLLTVPIWMIFTPLFLLTLALWYRPIKNWWQRTNRQGFMVEVNPNVETRPGLNHEGESNPKCE